MKKSVQFNNIDSAITHSDFVSVAIQDLLSTNGIIEVDELPNVVNPLSVTVQNCGKRRLILDWCYVNKNIYKERIKSDDLKLMEQFLNLHDHMFEFDVKQCYYHINICNPHQKYLGFSWEVGEKTCYFIFTVLPFGLTSAPFIFIKIMRRLLKQWIINAIRIAYFLDDGLDVAGAYKTTLF